VSQGRCASDGLRCPVAQLYWFPNPVWEPSSRNSVSRLLSHADEENAKQSFAEGVLKQRLGTRKKRQRRGAESVAQLIYLLLMIEQ
jgi:hypothetical protein